MVTRQATPRGTRQATPRGTRQATPRGTRQATPRGTRQATPRGTRQAPAHQPTTLSFDPVRSSRVRLDMTSAAPGTGAGFLQIVELRVLSGGTAVT